MKNEKPKVKKEVKEVKNNDFIGYAVVVHKLKKGQSNFTIKNSRGETPDRIVPMYIDRKDYKDKSDEELGDILRFGIDKLNE